MTTELRQIEKNRVTLKEMVNRKENALCADCGRRRPRWASINLGVFICDTCAGVHRGIGVHITQVRSIDLDDWKNDWVKVMETMGGNLKANEFYEAKNKNPVKTEVTNEPYIREKYVDKKWQGKPKASKKPTKKEESSESESEEEEVKPKPKPKKPVAKKVESESEEEVKPKKKPVAKKVENSDSDSETEKPKSRKSKKAEEAPKKKDQGFEPLQSASNGKGKSSTAAPNTRKPETASSTWDPFAQGVAQVQEQQPTGGDEWSMFTNSPKPAQASHTQPAKAPGSSWDAFGTESATTGIAGLQVSGSQTQPQTQPVAAQPAKAAGPSKGDILGLFDQAPSGSQMGMGMSGMGMPGMGMPGMGMSGMGMSGMMPLMNAQQQQQYMMQQRMNPMQQQQFMMQQQQLMMMMMQQQQHRSNPLFPSGQQQYPHQQQQFSQHSMRPTEPSFF